MIGRSGSQSFRGGMLRTFVSVIWRGPLADTRGGKAKEGFIATARTQIQTVRVESRESEGCLLHRQMS